MDANLEKLEEAEGTGSAQNGPAEEASRGHDLVWEEEKEELSDISYNITSYGADYMVDGIVRRFRQGDIFVPDFQRKFVWTWTQSSRFIESLLLGLPVPGIFLYKEKDSEKMQIVDGQQRILSLERFYPEEELKTHKSKSRIHKPLKGDHEYFFNQHYNNLKPEFRRKLDNSILHATIFEQRSPESNCNSIYEVFGRINTGGTLLHSQEVRSCLYYGNLSRWLRDFNSRNKEWRKFLNHSKSDSHNEELILRIIALKQNLSSYNYPLKHFLNSFMESNRDPSQEWLNYIEKWIHCISKFAVKNIHKEIFFRNHRVVPVIAEAILIGIWNRIEELEGNDISESSFSRPELLQDAAAQLLKDAEFQKLTKHKTTSLEAVKGRIEKATKAFKEVV
ncbi:MAG: DUF262 domain-containing protein [Cyanobacteria bacterium MAG CAR3_bin_5]|nr:DUF262 domain-containing protein [Cyanobacteria bacterium MAG CAR3_bin_5]